MSAQEYIVYYGGIDNFSDWKSAIAREIPDVALFRHDESFEPAKVRYAMVWKPPLGFFSRFSNLMFVANLGAGVDAILASPDLPEVPITRIYDPGMAKLMSNYISFAVLRYARDIPLLEAQQKQQVWQYKRPRNPDEIRVGFLGIGELGAHAAKQLAQQGFAVTGCSRSASPVDGIEKVYPLERIKEFLNQTEILVVMLPLTRETRGLIDAELLSALPEGAKIINPARGAIFKEADLIGALQSGHIEAATLDTFEVEPLPKNSPLWTLPNVLITPHLASHPVPSSSAPQIAENIRRMRRGDKLLNEVFRSRGY